MLQDMKNFVFPPLKALCVCVCWRDTDDSLTAWAGVDSNGMNIMSSRLHH